MNKDLCYPNTDLCIWRSKVAGGELSTNGKFQSEMSELVSLQKEKEKELSCILL